MAANSSTFQGVSKGVYVSGALYACARAGKKVVLKS